MQGSGTFRDGSVLDQFQFEAKLDNGDDFHFSAGDGSFTFTATAITNLYAGCSGQIIMQGQGTSSPSGALYTFMVSPRLYCALVSLTAC